LAGKINIISKQDTRTLFLQEFQNDFFTEDDGEDDIERKKKSLNLLKKKLIDLDFINDWIPEFIN